MLPLPLPSEATAAWPVTIALLPMIDGHVPDGEPVLPAGTAAIGAESKNTVSSKIGTNGAGIVVVEAIDDLATRAAAASLKPHNCGATSPVSLVGRNCAEAAENVVAAEPMLMFGLSDVAERKRDLTAGKVETDVGVDCVEQRGEDVAIGAGGGDVAVDGVLAACI